MKTNSFIKTLLFFSLSLVLLSGKCAKEPLISIDFNDTIITDFAVQPTPAGTVFPVTVEVVRDRVISLQDAIRGKGLDPKKVNNVTLDNYIVKLITPADRDLRAVSEVKVYFFYNGNYVQIATGNNRNAAVKQFSLTPDYSALQGKTPAQIEAEIKAYMRGIADLNNVNLKYKYTYVINSAIDQKAEMQAIYDYTVDFK
jgi:hypothetical protein